MIVGCYNFFLKILIFEIIIFDFGLWLIFMIDLKKLLWLILCLVDFKIYMYMIGYVYKIFRIGYLWFVVVYFLVVYFNCVIFWRLFVM